MIEANDPNRPPERTNRVGYEHGPLEQATQAGCLSRPPEQVNRVSQPSGTTKRVNQACQTKIQQTAVFLVPNKQATEMNHIGRTPQQEK